MPSAERVYEVDDYIINYSMISQLFYGGLPIDRESCNGYARNMNRSFSVRTIKK